MLESFRQAAATLAAKTIGIMSTHGNKAHLLEADLNL